MQPHSYYTPDGDIAYLSIRGPEGAVKTRKELWGLCDFDERGELVGVEVWAASERLAREVLEALPRLEGLGIIVERQPE